MGSGLLAPLGKRRGVAVCHVSVALHRRSSRADKAGRASRRCRSCMSTYHLVFRAAKSVLLSAEPRGGGSGGGGVEHAIAVIGLLMLRAKANKRTAPSRMRMTIALAHSFATGNRPEQEAAMPNVRFGWKADVGVALDVSAVQPGGMENNPLGWPERHELIRALEAIVTDASSPDRIGLCLDTILHDLELYDDPHQGRGSWLFDDEVPLAEELGERLAGVVGATRPLEAGPEALRSAGWRAARETALALSSLMKRHASR